MYSNIAKDFVKHLSCLVNNEAAKENFICYLSYHFPEWLAKFANNPENITEEIKEFAHMFD